jgi:hypothetical protein
MKGIERQYRVIAVGASRRGSPLNDTLTGETALFGAGVGAINVAVVQQVRCGRVALARVATIAPDRVGWGEKKRG